MTLDAAVAAGAVAGCRTTDGCTSAELAQTDLVDWRAAMTAAIPGSTGEIAVAGNTYTITLNWDDNRDGVVNADPDDEIDDDPSFQVSFQP
jgi:type IV pilus assembly protein PilV